MFQVRNFENKLKQSFTRSTNWATLELPSEWIRTTDIVITSEEIVSAATKNNITKPEITRLQCSSHILASVWTICWFL